MAPTAEARARIDGKTAGGHDRNTAIGSPSKGAQDTNPLRFDADLRQRRLPVATGAEAEAIINFQLANGVSFQSKLLVR